MDVMHKRVGGLDVHKQMIVACVRIMASRKAGREVSRECRTFDTTTDGLQALLAWLTECGCTHVAMEATGVYWKPVWNILSDGEFELVVANAAHIKNVPGRKTDMNDAMWIADLMACGLIRASFVPEERFQDLRSLMRARKQLTREQTSHVQRLQKTLEEANIKLDSVISDILGVSGRRMLEAMIAGETDPSTLAALAHRGLKASPEELSAALKGRLTDHHRFLLKLYLGQRDSAEEAILELDREVDERISRMDAQGHVVVSNPLETGRGDFGVYNADTGIATLIGNVVIERGKDVIRGQRGVMDLNNNIARMLPGNAPGGAAPRVQGLFARQQQTSPSAATTPASNHKTP